MLYRQNRLNRAPCPTSPVNRRSLTVSPASDRIGPVPNKVFVIGVGITKFEKPFSRDWDYPDMAREAGQMALRDAGLTYDSIQQVCAGYVFGDSTSGQNAVYELGLTGVPV